MATKPAIECTPVDLTDEQRANLAKLAAYLRTLPANYSDFGMAEFSSDRDDSAHVVKCGTVACAVGHGPKAGVPAKRVERWVEYGRRAFIRADRPWDWCFSDCWDDVDNTVHGAAARIEWLLKHGLPENSCEQEFGDAPLCYSTEASA